MMSTIPSLTVWGLDSLFAYAFMRNALIAGTAVALVCGLAGYFIVLRGQLFTGDALGHVAFTGALGALVVGLDARIGLFTACVGIALLLAALGPRGRVDDTAIGSVFAWVLGLGVAFLSYFTSSRSAGNGAAGARVLFGSIFGLDGNQTFWAVAIAVLGVCALLAIARPLLFATLDEAVAAARGVPVRALGFFFLGIVGLAAAEASQVVGALLLLGLLATPAGAAHRLTARPFWGLGLSAGIAVFSLWMGLVLSYAIPGVPPSFSILAVASGVYAATWVPAGYGLLSRHASVQSTAARPRS